MKRYQKICIIIGWIMIVLGVIMGITAGKVDVVVRTIIMNSVYFLMLGAMVMVLLPGIIEFFLLLKNGMHNIRKCDDEVFAEIDWYKERLEDSNESYMMQIDTINLFYRKNGKIDKIVEDGEIDRLFQRKDYLDKHIGMYGDMIACLVSVCLSILASALFQTFQMQNSGQILVVTIVVVLFFFAVIFMKYAEGGKSGSYMYMVETYERELLEEKIRTMERERGKELVEEDEAMLLTKQAIICELLKLRQKAKGKSAKEKIERDIKTVEKLNVCLHNYEDCHLQAIFINSRKGYLVYDKELGKVNNYMGDFNLKNREMSTMYYILSKYNLQ